MMPQVTNFLITQLLWNVIAGSYYIVFNFLLLFLLFKTWDHLSWSRALLLSLFFSIGTFVLFFLIVNGIVKSLNVSYWLPDDTYKGTYNYLHTSLIHSIIYMFIQSILLFFVHLFMRLNVGRMMLSIICANIMCALIIYKIMFNI